MINFDDYMTLQELAELTRTNHSTAYRVVVKRGEIGHTRFGTKILVSKAEVKRYLDRRFSPSQERRAEATRGKLKVLSAAGPALLDPDEVADRQGLK